MRNFDGFHPRQTGMVLLISLVFLLVLSLIGLASMQGAVSQQRIASGVWHRNQSFQSAESGLRLGESMVRRAGSVLPLCQSISACAPSPESFSVVGTGQRSVSAVSWVAFKGGLYGIQALGQGTGLTGLPLHTSARLYRVTAVGFSGQSRTVLETVYAQVNEAAGARFRRTLWRQLQ
ncbi:PilX N-terminal domain-containing pilus assembly protein [Pseudomonas sp. N2-5-1-1]|uniref:pilus assembly PilX family protein n=1 Tax=unclassified Pseudomonas TaxID=196821 RepID=UPI0034E08E8B